MSGRKVLVTGASGFAGAHLVDYLESEGHEVLGIGRSAGRPGKRYVRLDLAQKGVAPVLKEFAPEYILHLAGQSSVAESWRGPAATFEANVVSLARLLEAAAALDRKPVVVAVGSSEEYGVVDSDRMPIVEEQPAAPRSPYATSKVCGAYLCRQFFEWFALPVIWARSFNHTGPGQKLGFVCSDFARQLVRIKKGAGASVLEVGNLRARRDFTDVRDIVRCYWRLALAGQAGEVYNVCSGKAYSIAEIVAMLIEISGLKIELRQDPDRERPVDIPVLLGDSAKTFAVSGWRPQIPLEQSLADLFAWWEREEEKS